MCASARPHQGRGSKRFEPRGVDPPPWELPCMRTQLKISILARKKQPASHIDTHIPKSNHMGASMPVLSDFHGFQRKTSSPLAKASVMGNC